MDDEVTLKDGGTLRGVVTSVEPGKSVKVMVIGEKESRTLPWARVADVEKGKYAPASRLTAPGSAGMGYGAASRKPSVVTTTPTENKTTTKATDPKSTDPKSTNPTDPKSTHPKSTDPKPTTRQPVESPSPDVAVEKRRVRVHLDSPEPTTLMRVTATPGPGTKDPARAEPEKVCTSPCDAEVDVEGGDRFYADGSFPSTGTFDLYDTPPDQTAVVRVKPGSAARLVGGVVSLAGGAVLGAIGVGVLSVDYLECAVGCPLEEANSFTDRAIGGTLVSVGIAGVVGGVILIAMSGSSASVGEAADDKPGPTARLWIGGPADPRPTPTPLTRAPVVVGIQGSF